MSDFEEWVKPQLPYFKSDRDLEVIVEVAFIEKAYEAGRKAGLEEAHIIATMQIGVISDSPCFDICTEIEERIRQ